MSRFFSFFLAIAFIFVNINNARSEVIDRVVAVVNDDIITLSDVETAGKEVLAKAGSARGSFTEKNRTLQQVRLNILQALIEEKIVEQEANKRNLKVSEEEAHNALTRILEGRKISQPDFRQQLAALGSTEEQYLINLKRQILVSKLVNTEIRSKIIVTDDQIVEFYQQNYTKNLEPDEYYILQFGCLPQAGTMNSAAEAEALQRAKKIRDLAVSGQDFRELARKHSELPSAADGGDIGVFKKNEMAAQMRDAILEIKPGQITRIIKTTSGYQFFKLVANQAGEKVTTIPFESVKEEIRETLYQERVKTSYDKWLEELRRQAFIQILL